MCQGPNEYPQGFYDVYRVEEMNAAATAREHCWPPSVGWALRGRTLTRAVGPVNETRLLSEHPCGARACCEHIELQNSLKSGRVLSASSVAKNEKQPTSRLIPGDHRPDTRRRNSSQICTGWGLPCPLEEPAGYSNTQSSSSSKTRHKHVRSSSFSSSLLVTPTPAQHLSTPKQTQKPGDNKEIYTFVHLVLYTCHSQFLGNRSKG